MPEIRGFSKSDGQNVQYQHDKDDFRNPTEWNQHDQHVRSSYWWAEEIPDAYEE